MIERIVKPVKQVFNGKGAQACGLIAMKVTLIANRVCQGLYALVWILWACIALLGAGLPRASKAEEPSSSGAAGVGSPLSAAQASMTSLSVLPSAYSSLATFDARSLPVAHGPSSRHQATATQGSGAWHIQSGAIGPLQLLEPAHNPRHGEPQVRRPRFALVFHSPGLKRQLEAMGLKPQACQAPIIRARGKLTGGGDVNGSFWISARCALW